MKAFWFWLTHNASSSPNRLMARYLVRHGWVAFYLPCESRECRELCWMQMYKNQG